MANRVSRKRFLLIAVLAVAASVVFVPGAGAGNFDEVAMGCTGEDPMICPSGTTGQPYSLPVKLLGDEDLACATFSFQGGSPPGLTITPHPNETNAGRISGTPTQAGSFDFYLLVTYHGRPGAPSWCGKPPSDDRIVININPSIPKLTIGPESAPTGTVNTPYQLQMTANLPDAKTWSLAGGTLPTGLTLGQSNGLISGTPTAAGTFTFTVHAQVSPQQTDTKTLTINIREALAIAAPAEVPGSEVGVRFQIFLTASGGFGAYTWALASGALPPGIILGSKGALAGRPTEAGSYTFAISVTDQESRVATYDGEITVAERLAVATLAMKQGKVGKRYQQKLLSSGGVAPAAWTLKTGPLPKGIRFNRATGILAGVPKVAGRFRVVFEIRDALGVVARKSFLIRIAAAPVKKKRR